MSFTQPHGSSAPATPDTSTSLSDGDVEARAGVGSGRQRQPAHAPMTNAIKANARENLANATRGDVT